MLGEVGVTRETRNTFAFIAPFATWIALQMLLPATAGAYAARSGATLLVLLAALPLIVRASSRSRDPSLVPSSLGPSSFFFGLFGGLLVLALWVLPEFSDLYRTWCVWPLGSLPAAATAPSPYDPAVCGWPLTLAKLAGSAFVIAPVEELFFRSFLYRWLQKRDFSSVPHTRLDLSAFLWTVFLFTLEHDRPLAAALCAVIYGLLYVRCGLTAAIVAHVTTNLLLAVYVVFCGQWAFW